MKYYCDVFDDALGFDQADRAREWLRETFSSWEESLTDAEREAVRRYKGDDYEQVNDALRNREGLDEDLLAVVEDLDVALERMRVPESVVVYRGIDDSSADVISELQPGFTREEMAYASTSLLRQVTEYFLDRAEVPVLQQILIPGGATVGAFVGAPDLVS